MGRRITSLDGQEFDALFTSFERGAFRLETLQVYAGAYEDEVRAVLAGDPRPANPIGDKWAARIRADRVAGKTWQRVHVIEEPRTDYLRYELAVYARNVAAGEDVRVIPVSRGDWPTPSKSTGTSDTSNCSSRQPPPAKMPVLLIQRARNELRPEEALRQS